MKLNKIFIDSNISSQKGIAEVDLRRLNNVVAFVGKNGSGKTRILNLIVENSQKLISINRFLDESVSDPPKVLKSTLKQLSSHKDYILSQQKVADLQQKLKQNPTDEKLKIEDNIAQNLFKRLQKNYNTIEISRQRPGLKPNSELQNIASTLKNAESQIQKINFNYIIKIKNEEILQLQEAMIDDKNIKFLSFDKLVESVAENVDYNVFTSINKSSLNFLKILPHQLVFDYMDCMGDQSKYEKRISFKRFTLLKKLCKDFLDKDLTWEQKNSDKKLTDEGVQSFQSGVWKLDDRLFDYNELSDGEKTLLAYIFLFFLIEQNPNLRVSESIFIIDEPELHLHPDSEIDLISGIRKTISPKGQLLIATHSINILSDLNIDEIFMVKKGEIFHPSRKIPGESLAELMSIDDRIIKLSNFLTSGSDWSYINFMTQCFLEPDVVAHSDQNDPQFLSFKNAIKNITKKGNNLLLDFGAGKGRLFELFKKESELSSRILYSALEPEESYHKDLKDLGVSTIFKNHNELQESSFEFIVLCNVLHEIPLNEWVISLNSIAKALKDNGYLLLIEDKLLPKGEKIGEIGFLILDDESIKELFGLNQLPISFADTTNSDRIICSVIPKNKMSRIDKNKLKNSIIKLQSNILTKIKELRKSNNIDNNIHFGRISGFYSQQYINTIFALENIATLK